MAEQSRLLPPALGDVRLHDWNNDQEEVEKLSVRGKQNNSRRRQSLVIGHGPDDVSRIRRHLQWLGRMARHDGPSEFDLSITHMATLTTHIEHRLIHCNCNRDVE